MLLKYKSRPLALPLFFEMCPKYPPSEIAGLMKPAYENPLVALNEAGD